MRISDWSADVCSSDRAAAERHRPNVGLMDIRLAQGTDGVEAARMIRDRLGIRSIFISAHTDAATVSRMRTVDPIGVLHKPSEAPLLAAVLLRAFEPPHSEPPPRPPATPGHPRPLPRPPSRPGPPARP